LHPSTHSWQFAVTNRAEPTPRRAYNSPIRRQQAEATRARIVAAGSELAHEHLSWDWRELTYRRIAERAGVGERTVYRHFPTERHLHDAIMRRLHEEAGVDYDDVRLATLPGLTARIFESLGSFAVVQTTMRPDAPTFHAVDVERRAALRRAVDEAAPGWDDEQRETAAAVLDVLWNVPTYERLVSGWQLDDARASDAVSWVMRLVIDAIERGAPPAP
jgi:AcrR family transcriptional regulator